MVGHFMDALNLTCQVSEGDIGIFGMIFPAVK